MKTWFGRLTKFCLLALCVTWLEIHVNNWTHTEGVPAGFCAGMVDGALMPMSMPALMAGRDMPIYAVRNAGRIYKLGYTIGVNGCGAVFFGVVFWRFARWNNARRLRSSPGMQP